MTTPIDPDVSPVCVAALYRFAHLEDIASLRPPLQRLCEQQSVQGTLILADEGINGTIAGPDAGIERVLAHIRSWPGYAALDVKYSTAATMPFHRMKVRLKREIVTMGQPDIAAASASGTYVEPEDWNALVDDPGTIIIDTRNDYEIAIGSFAGAIDPKTPTFRDFPAWFERERERLLGSGKAPKVAMFCTGGIRCEKASAFLKREGLEDVFHLRGGVLAYLEKVPQEASRWRGECFVFDQRVAVGHGLAPGTHTMCFACRRPVSPADRKSTAYEEGVACPACINERDEHQRRAYRERHVQEQRAARHGRAHVGAVLAKGSDDDRA